MSKKIDMKNPVLDILNRTASSEADPLDETPPKGYKPNPKFIETKSKRVNLLMQPTTVAQGKAVAKSLGISFNEFVNRAVKAEIKKLKGEDK